MYGFLCHFFSFLRCKRLSSFLTASWILGLIAGLFYALSVEPDLKDSAVSILNGETSFIFLFSSFHTFFI